MLRLNIERVCAHVWPASLTSIRAILSFNGTEVRDLRRSPDRGRSIPRPRSAQPLPRCTPPPRPCLAPQPRPCLAPPPSPCAAPRGQSSAPPWGARPGAAREPAPRVALPDVGEPQGPFESSMETPRSAVTVAAVAARAATWMACTVSRDGPGLASSTAAAAAAAATSLRRRHCRSSWGMDSSTGITTVYAQRLAQASKRRTLNSKATKPRSIRQAQCNGTVNPTAKK